MSAAVLLLVLVIALIAALTYVAVNLETVYSWFVDKLGNIAVVSVDFELVVIIIAVALIAETLCLWFRFELANIDLFPVVVKSFAVVEVPTKTAVINEAVILSVRNKGVLYDT